MIVSQACKASTRSDQKLRERCTVLAKVVSALIPVYYSPSTTTNQKQLLETMIGAAIWYFPQSSELWTGFASIEAAQDMNNKIAVTKDHAYPRKVAARELLSLSEHELNGDNIYRLYKEKFGKFNYVTKTQNRKLMRFQRADSFNSSEKCYSEAQIKLEPYQRPARLKKQADAAER